MSVHSFQCSGVPFFDSDCVQCGGKLRDSVHGRNDDERAARSDHRQLLAIKSLCDAIVQAVDAAGPGGAPGGVLYVALMSQGCELNQFERIMAGMVGSGLLCKVGECYFLGELGLEMMKGGRAS